jgi:Fur family peroxide stress response transcriptional regulator
VTDKSQVMVEENQARLQDIILKLRKRGCRLTPQRMAVLNIVVNSNEHLNADQIYERVKSDFPMTSLATVYKTLSVLKDMDELIELSFGSEGNRYDGNKPYPHPHVICVKCNTIIDPDIPILDGLQETVAVQSGFQIISHRMDFFGICPQCSEDE